MDEDIGTAFIYYYRSCVYFKGRECFHFFSKTLREWKQSPFKTCSPIEWKLSYEGALPYVSQHVYRHLDPWNNKGNVLLYALIYVTNWSTVIILMMSLHNRNLLIAQ